MPNINYASTIAIKCRNCRGNMNTKQLLALILFSELFHQKVCCCHTLHSWLNSKCVKASWKMSIFCRLCLKYKGMNQRYTTYQNTQLFLHPPTPPHPTPILSGILDRAATNRILNIVFGTVRVVWTLFVPFNTEWLDSWPFLFSLALTGVLYDMSPTAPGHRVTTFFQNHSN